jgi:hypothetical protein
MLTQRVKSVDAADPRRNRLARELVIGLHPSKQCRPAMTHVAPGGTIIQSAA